MKRLLLYPFAAVILLAGEPAVGATLDALPSPRALEVGTLRDLPGWVATAASAIESPPSLPNSTASAGDRAGRDRDSRAIDEVKDAKPGTPRPGFHR